MKAICIDHPSEAYPDIKAKITAKKTGGFIIRILDSDLSCRRYDVNSHTKEQAINFAKRILNNYNSKDIK